MAPGQSLAQLSSRVRVAEPNDRNEFNLATRLRDRLTPGGNDFDLRYSLKVVGADAGITPDQVITKRQIDGSVVYTLVDSATGATIATGTVESFTTYGTTGTTASTAFARTAAFERLMTILADKIVTRLAALEQVPA